MFWQSIWLSRQLCRAKSGLPFLQCCAKPHLARVFRGDRNRGLSRRLFSSSMLGMIDEGINVGWEIEESDRRARGKISHALISQGISP